MVHTGPIPNQRCQTLLQQCYYVCRKSQQETPKLSFLAMSLRFNIRNYSAASYWNKNYIEEVLTLDPNWHKR